MLTLTFNAHFRSVQNRSTRERKWCIQNGKQLSQKCPSFDMWYALNHSHVLLQFTGVLSSVNPIQSEPCVLPWPRQAFVFYVVKLCTASSLNQDWNLRGYLLNSTVNQVDCLLCLISVFRASPQSWSCNTDWTKTTTRRCHLAEQFESKSFEGKTSISDRLQVLHRH